MNKLSAAMAIVIAFSVQQSVAQNTFPTVGNTGIGTTTPGSGLEVRTESTNYADGSLFLVNGINSTFAGYATLAGIKTIAPDRSDYNLFKIQNASGTKLVMNGLGNVGLGTTTPSYYSGYTGLSLNNSVNGGVIDFSKNGVMKALVSGDEAGLNLFAPENKAVHIIAGAAEQITVLKDGNTGFGTMSPGARLEVAAPAQGTAAGVFHLNGGQAYGHVVTLATDGATGDDARLLFSYRSNAKQWSLGGHVNTTRFSIWEDGGDATHGNGFGAERLTVLPGGNVGIGINNPAEKLAVNGTIHSKEVKVDLLNWPDYVFNQDYQLPTLSDVKAFINQNHRLPEMPSAVKVDQEGLSLGEINKILTKKIEELTLYLIEKDTQLKSVNASFASQESKMKRLEQRLEKLENNTSLN